MEHNLDATKALLNHFCPLWQHFFSELFTLTDSYAETRSGVGTHQY